MSSRPLRLRTDCWICLCTLSQQVPRDPCLRVVEFLACPNLPLRFQLVSDNLNSVNHVPTMLLRKEKVAGVQWVVAHVQHDCMLWPVLLGKDFHEGISRLNLQRCCWLK